MSNPLLVIFHLRVLVFSWHQTKLAQLEQAFRARLADQKPTKASSLEPRGLSGDSGSSGSGGNGGSGGNAGSGSNDSKVRSNGKSSTSGNASSTSGSSSGCSSGSSSSAQKAKGGGRKRSGSGGSSTAGSKPSVITEDQRQFLPPDRRRDRGHLQQHQQPPPPPPLSLSGIVRSVGATSIEHFAGLFESAINENTAVAVAPGQLRAYAHLHGGPPYGDRQPFSSSSSLAVPYPPHHHHPGYSSGGSYSGNYDSTSGGAGYSHNSYSGNKNQLRHEMSSPLNDSYGHYDMDSSVEDAGAPRSPSLNRRSRRGSFDELTAAAAMVDAHSSSSSSSSSNHHDDGGSHSHSSEGHSSNGVRKGAPPRVFADGYAYRSDELQGGGGIARQGAGVGSIDLGVFGSMNMDSCGDAGIRAWRYRASSPTPAPPSSVSAVSSMPELLGTNSNHSGSYGSSGGPNPPGGAVKNGVSGAMPFFGNSTGSAVSLNNHMGDANSNSSSSSSSSSSSLSSASSSQHSQRHRANSWSEGQSTCLPRSTSWQSNSNNNNAQDTSGTPTPTTSASGAAAGIGWSSPRTPRLYGSGVDSGGSSGGGSGVSGGWSPRVRGEGERERGGGSLNVPSSPATREAARLAEGGLLLGFFQSVQKSASTGDLEGLLQHASQQEASSNSAATPASSSSSSFSSSSSSSSATDRSAFPRFPPTSPQRSPPPMPVLELAPTNLTFGSSSYLNDLLYSSSGGSGSGISSGDSGSSSFYAHHHHPLRVHPTGALHLFPGSPNSAAAAAAATAAAATFLPASAPVIDGAFAAPPTSQSPLLAVDETSRTDLFFDASSSSSSLPAVTPEEGHPPRTAPPLPASLYFSALQRTASRKVTPESRGNLSATGDGQSSSVPPSSLPSPQISPALSAQSTHSNEGASLSSLLLLLLRPLPPLPPLSLVLVAVLGLRRN